MIVVHCIIEPRATSVGVSVHASCYNNTSLFLPALEAGSPIKVPADSVSGEGWLSSCRLPPSLCIFMGGESRSRKGALPDSYRGSNPILEPHPQDLISS